MEPQSLPNTVSPEQEVDQVLREHLKPHVARLKETQELHFKQVLAESMTTPENPWRQPEQCFDPSTRLVNDPDLFQVVTDSLKEIDHPMADTWDKEFSVDGAILRTARNYPPEGQIYFINRYWRNWFRDNVQSYDTFPQRRALVDSYAAYADWINLFKLAVAPYIPRPEIQDGQEPTSSTSDVPEASE